MARTSLSLTAFLIVISGLLYSTFTYCQNKEFDEFIGREKARALHEAVSSFDSFLEMNYRSEANYKAKATAFLNDFKKGNTENWRLDSIDTKRLIKDFERSGLRQEIWIFSKEIELSRDDYNEYYADLIHAMALYDHGKKRFISPHSVDSISALSDHEDLDGDETVYLDIPPVEGDSPQYRTDLPGPNCTWNRDVISGIHKFSNDSILWEYVQVKIDLCGIPKGNIASAMLKHGDKVDYGSYLMKVMLFMEFYSDILYPIWLQQILKEK